MDAMQVRLWRSIVADLGCLEIYDAFETPRNNELKILYYELCESFSNTLTVSQQKAFMKLSNISNALYSDSQDTGIALGIYIAGELQDFLSHPEKTLKEVSSSLSVSKMIGADIEALNEYFRRCDSQGIVTNS